MMLDETPPGTQPTRIRPTARSGGQVENTGDGPREEGHDGELPDGADENIKRALCQDDEILLSKGKAHGKHNHAEDNGLSTAFNPCEGAGKEKGDNCRKNNK